MQQSRITPKLSDASAKGYALLSRWEELAPLDAEQLAVVDLVAKHAQTRPLPAHLGSAPSVVDAPARPEAASSVEDGAVLLSSQAFYQWYSKLEAQRVCEAEQKYKDYAAALTTQLQTCHNASQLVNDTLSALEQTLRLHRDASGKSRSMRDTGERLVAEQEQLSAFGDAIRERLRHFEALDSIAADFHKVASSLDSADLKTQTAAIFEKLLDILERIDESLSYVTANPQHAESGVYETRYRQLHGRAVGGILHRVREVLKAAVKELNPAPATAAETLSEAEETNRYYVKFRALVEEQLQSVFAELAERGARPEYKRAFEECQKAWCLARGSLLRDLVKKRVEGMRGGALDGLLNEGFAYLIDVCRSEHQLFTNFFPGRRDTPPALAEMMDGLDTALYDEVRPRVIAVHSLDDLCAYISILQTELTEGEPEGAGESLDALRPVLMRTLADAQERLIYRAQAFIEEKLERHDPTVEEMTTLPPPFARRGQPVEREDGVRDERETWYGPLRVAVQTLEQLYDSLEPTVFGGIAHDAISGCSTSIAKAVAVLSKAKGAVEGQLFAIRHLLVLREELVRFNMDFLLTEKDLDFAHMRDHMRRVLSGEVSIFQLPASNVAQLVSWTVPRVTDTQVDSKKRLEKQLKESCEALIVIVTKAVVEPLLSFLAKAAALRGGESSQNRKSLSEHAFASPARLGEIASSVNVTLETTLPEIVTKMRRYLPVEGTFLTIYKPIKANILDAHAQMASVLEREYTEAEAKEVRLKSRDELISVTDL